MTVRSIGTPRLGEMCAAAEAGVQDRFGERFGTDGAAASEYFADIVAAVSQMETLTRNLVVLARLDGGLRAASHQQPQHLRMVHEGIRYLRCAGYKALLEELSSVR